MALVNCPKCGKEISTSAKICPHCGCEINVCPDCYTVYMQKPEICNNCGHIFVQPKNQDKSHLDFVENKIKIIYFLKKAVWILYGICYLLFIIAVIVYGVFLSSNPETQLNEFTSTYNSLRALIISSLVINAFSTIASPIKPFDKSPVSPQKAPAVDIMVYDRSPALTILKFILNANNIDGKQCCENYVMTVKKPVLYEYQLLLCATFLQKNKKEETLYYVRLILKATLSIVIFVCCGIFIMNFINTEFTRIFFETENEFLNTFSSYIPLIIGAVLWTVELFLPSNYKKVQEWCNNNSLTFDYNMK